MPPEQQPIIGHRPDKQRARDRRQHNVSHVQPALRCAQLGESGAERQGKEETEQDLYAEASDTKFLHQLAQVPVIPSIL